MALNTLQGYNSNSPRRTSLQRVFVRPKHLYTRRSLSLPCTVPPLHVRRCHVSQHAAPSAPKQPMISPWSRRASRDVPGRLQPRAEVFSVCSAFGSSRPSVPKHSHPCLRLPRPARSDRSPLHNKTHITRVALVFPSNPHRQDSLVLAEAACEPKQSARLDVDRASEGHFPQQ
jgi:hypothetical protein